MEVFPDLKIDLTADRTYAYNFSEQYDVSAGQYNSRAPYDFGNFNVSTILSRATIDSGLRSALAKSKNIFSTVIGLSIGAK